VSFRQDFSNRREVLNGSTIHSQAPMPIHVLTFLMENQVLGRVILSRPLDARLEPADHRFTSLLTHQNAAWGAR
jgi:hypothetical protein